MLTSVTHTGPHERDKKHGSSELVRVENSWVQSAMVKPFLVLRFAYLTSMSLGWREQISEYAKILVVQGSSRNARPWHCHNGYTRKRHLFVTLATYVPCVHPISVVLIRLTRTPPSWFVVRRRLKLDVQPTDLFHLTQTPRRFRLSSTRLSRLLRNRDCTQLSSGKTVVTSFKQSPSPNRAEPQ